MSDTSSLVGGGIAVAGCTVAVLATLAMLLVPTIDDRLHFMAPVTTIAAPLVGAGLIVDNGVTLGSGEIALVVVLLAAGGPAITAAIARAKTERARPDKKEPE